MTERTLVLVKPDGVARGLVGEVLGRLERKGFRIVAVDCARSTARRPRPTTPSTTANRSSTRSWTFITSAPAAGRGRRGPGRDRRPGGP